MGSSVGISKSENQEELRQALKLAFQYDSRVLVEQGVNAREIEVGLLGNYDVKSTLPGEVVKDVAFYDYDAKYIDNKITMDIPAKISDDVVVVMRQNAETAFRAIGGPGLSRCDFFYTDKGEIFLNDSIPCQVSPSGQCIHYFGTIWESATQKLIERFG